MLEASIYANENNFYKKGIGLMDSILIKAAEDGNLKIWTLDKRIVSNLGSKYLYK